MMAASLFRLTPEAAARTEAQIERARLEGTLRAICRLEGFPRTVEAAQAALQSIAAEVRAEGGELGGFVA